MSYFRAPRSGFSFIELLAVVAMIAILASASVPVASSLYRRNRENGLRETLLLIRMAIRDFDKNGYDDDADGRIDEDPRGDSNQDGFPGLRGVEDNVNGIDPDGKGAFATLPDGRPNPNFDIRFRADDDEDGLIDEEALPTDMNDLVAKMRVLRGEIPPDPTTGEASWRVVVARIDNDGDGLIDEDPRDGLDNDGDNRIDEDPPEMIDVRSWNSSEATDGTTYSSW